MIENKIQGLGLDTTYFPQSVLQLRNFVGTVVIGDGKYC